MLSSNHETFVSLTSTDAWSGVDNLALDMKLIKIVYKIKNNMFLSSIANSSELSSKWCRQLGFASAHCRSSASSHLFPESPSINSLELFDGLKVNSFIFSL